MQAEQLYQVVARYVVADTRTQVLDAYCGTGSIALYVAQAGAAIVWGVEVETAAVHDAQINAQLNNVSNVRFYAGKVEEVVAELVQKGNAPNVVVVDPPRSGCDAEFLATACSWQADRWVYVSCNPATLARDMRIIMDNGYNVVEAQPVDMFPHTAHVETVVLMSRVEK
jgi:23S rRNA (uracil1939-C5)-methyltransferase